MIAKPVQCDMCNVMVKNLRAHNRNVHKERRYNCNICDKVLKLKGRHDHMMRHAKKEQKTLQNSTSPTKRNKDKQEEEVQHECSICSKKFSEMYLKHHKKSVHMETEKIECNYCNNYYSNSNNLEVHINRIHKNQGNENKPIKCSSDDCEKRFWNTSEMVSHSKCHDDVRSFQCEMCEKSYKVKHGLATHMLLHTGQRPFKCLECSFDSTDLAILKRHQVYKHLGEKTFKCDSCDKAFKLKSEMQRHKNGVHLKLYAVSCLHCGKSCSSQGDLKKHTKTHTNDRPHACNICDAKYIRKYQLEIHMRMHTGEKPLACTFCEKRFSWPTALRFHVKTHTGEKPYGCTQCDKRFIQSI